MVLALGVSACTAADEPDQPATAASEPPATATSPTGSPSTIVEDVIPAPLEGYPTRVVVIGDREFYSAVADTPNRRRMGFMEVTDPGPIEGMLFVWTRERPRRFWMYKTPLPLDIAFFDAAGRFVNKHTMQPCMELASAGCLRYLSDTPAQYAFEAPAGALEFVDDSTILEIG